MLLEKGIIDPQQALCPFCNLEIETNSHMLFTCSFSWSIWMEVLDWWGILGVLHKNCGDFCVQRNSLMKGRKWGKLWKLVLRCTIWSLWYTRNKVKFEMVPPDQGKASYSLKIRIGVWAKELLGYVDLSPLVSNKEFLLT